VETGEETGNEERGQRRDAAAVGRGARGHDDGEGGRVTGGGGRASGRATAVVCGMQHIYLKML